MKALILAAGYGTRLGSLTSNRPKSMVTVGKKPVLEHVINYLNGQGITEIAVNLHYLPKSIINYFGDRLVYFYEPNLLGTAGTIKKVGNWLGADFLVLNGDTLTNLNINRLVQSHMISGCVATASRDLDSGVCTGMMVFNWQALTHLPDVGMVDRFLESEDFDINDYFNECTWIDMGTPQGLKQARRLVRKN